MTFESAASEWRQGVWLRTDRGVVINEIDCPSATVWMDNSPGEVLIMCHSTDGFLHVYNIWDRGRGRESQLHTSGMKIEEIANGRRYRCNTFGFDKPFNDVIFRIERRAVDTLLS